MPNKFEIGDQVRVALDEGLDTPREARDKIGVVTGTIGNAEEGTLEYLVQVQELPLFNYCEYHLTKVYEVQYVIRNIGSGLPGRHICTGCKRLFVKDEIFEIGSVYLPNDDYAVVHVHKNRACQNAAIIAVT